MPTFSSHQQTHNHACKLEYIFWLYDRLINLFGKEFLFYIMKYGNDNSNAYISRELPH